MLNTDPGEQTIADAEVEHDYSSHQADGPCTPGCDAVNEARIARAALHDAEGLIMDVEAAIARQGAAAPPLAVERSIEVGIGLASPAPDCDLCQKRNLACPRHAAGQVVLALVRDGHLRFGYTPA